MRETWKSVVGYGGLYEVSDLGNVRRAVKYLNSTDAPLKQVVTSAYRRVCLSKENKRVNHLVHRLVAQAFIGISDGLVVNHINGDKFDNRLENLEVVSRAENERHKWRVLKRGSRNNVRLSQADASAIREQYKKAKSYRALAAKYGVHYSTIAAIVRGETWRES